MDMESDSKERMEQFYKLLSAYGLTGQTQPLNRQGRQDLDKLFTDEDE